MSGNKNSGISPTGSKKIFDTRFEYPRSDIETFKTTIVPIMDRLRHDYSAHPDAYMKEIVREVREKGLTINENIGNMIVDRMAVDRIPKNAWDYITSQAGNHFNAKAIADTIQECSNIVWGKEISPLEKEIQNRVKAFYDPNVWESLGAVSAATLANTVAELPLVLGSGGYSVLFDAAIVGYNEVSERDSAKSTLELEHRNQFIHTLVDYYSRQDQNDDIKVPSWMIKQGLHGQTFDTVSDKQLALARAWAQKQETAWWNVFEKIKDRTPNEKGYTFHDNTTGKNYTTNEILKKYKEYSRFALECTEVMSSRKSQHEIEMQRLEAERQKQLEEANKTPVDNIDEMVHGEESNISTSSAGGNSQKQLEVDPWGIALSSWKKNSGFEELLKHPGSTIASIPDVLMGMFTGKTEFKSDMLMPLACIVSGLFTGNSLLKVPLIMGGAASIVGKIANSENANQSEQTLQNNEPRYKQYKDVELDPRISNPQLNGNTLMLDIDHSPYVVAISSTAVDAYQKGSLPLNVIANSVLANLDQTRQASREQQQQLQQSMQNTEREQNIRIK